MTGPSIAIDEQHFAVLRAHLVEPEKVVFAYATFTAGRFEVAGLDVIEHADVASRSDLHVVLADDVRPRLITTAWKRGMCLIEAHSHGSRGLAEFSGSDLRGFDEWIPHLWWRLRGRPYAALVMAGTQWDALAWTRSASEPEPVSRIEIQGAGREARPILPTGATLARFESRRSRRRRVA